MFKTDSKFLGYVEHKKVTESENILRKNTNKNHIVNEIKLRGNKLKK